MKLLCYICFIFLISTTAIFAGVTPTSLSVGSNVSGSNGYSYNSIGGSLKLSEAIALNGSYFSSTGDNSYAYDEISFGIEVSPVPITSFSASYISSEDHTGLAGRGSKIGLTVIVSELWKDKYRTSIGLSYKMMKYSFVSINFIEQPMIAPIVDIDSTKFSQNEITFSINQELFNDVYLNLEYSTFQYEDISFQKVESVVNQQTINSSEIDAISSYPKESISASVQFMMFEKISTDIGYSLTSFRIMNSSMKTVSLGLGYTFGDSWILGFSYSASSGTGMKDSYVLSPTITFSF